MDKKILVAVDGSVNALDAVQYATLMGDVVGDLTFELMVIQPALSQYLLDEAQLKPKARMALEKGIKANNAKANEILYKAAERMVRKGIAEDRINRLTRPKEAGVAGDLLVTGESKPYDAILVGRRGASYFRELVTGSVTVSLVEHSNSIPIWVVDGTVTSSDVLLAADGSNASLRALDHLAFVMAGDERRNLNLVHVRPRFKDYCEIDLEADSARSAHDVILSKDRRCMEDFYPQAQEVLAKYNIADDRVDIHQLEGQMAISRAILQYATDHHYGTIVMGRRGTSRSLFTGSVSRTMIDKAENVALWVVP